MCMYYHNVMSVNYDLHLSSVFCDVIIVFCDVIIGNTTLSYHVSLQEHIIIIIYTNIAITWRPASLNFQ